MSNKKRYWETFENRRRLSPRIHDTDYALLRGLARTISHFCDVYVSSHDVVLDFGCGARPYEPLFPSGCRYIGADVGENPYADIQFEPGECLPLENNSVDSILSTQVIYLVEEFRAYLSECRRVIKPSGDILISTHGTWTYHPASGGDFYRFTHQGLSAVLQEAGFTVKRITPIVGTLAAGLHLRQLVINAWLKKCHLGWIGKFLNIFINLRILAEDSVTPYNTRMSSPVILIAHAKYTQ